MGKHDEPFATDLHGACLVKLADGVGALERPFAVWAAAEKDVIQRLLAETA